MYIFTGEKKEEMKMARLNNLNFADEANKVIKSMIRLDKKGNPSIKLTTSKIRNMLTLTNNLYNSLIKIKGDTLPEEIISNIQ